MLRRTGFGTTGAQVDAAAILGLEGYVQVMMTSDPANDPGARATLPPTVAPLAPLGGRASGTELSRRARLLTAQQLALTVWWIRRMVTVTQPFGEKLTFCWHNHFATSAGKVTNPAWMLSQNDKLRTLGRGDFRTLATSMITDAAMLQWLDGEENTALAPNENLAREFMELFTLGHGDAYTEADVRQGARALTGLRVSADGTTRVDPRTHDGGSKTLLGVTGRLDVVGFVDVVLSQPASAGFVVRRMGGQLVSDDPAAPEVVDRLVGAYGDRRDLAAMLTAMLTAPEFVAAHGTMLVSPIEWVIGAARALRLPVATDAQAGRLLAILYGLGQVPFYPPNVGGWRSGTAWLSTAAVDLRMRAATALAGFADLSALDGAMPSRVDAVAYLLGISTWSARSAELLRSVAGNPRQLIAVALNTPEYVTN